MNLKEILMYTTIRTIFLRKKTHLRIVWNSIMEILANLKLIRLSIVFILDPAQYNRTIIS